MNIKNKLIIGFGILSSLVVASSVIGIYGVNRVADSLRFVTTSAWDAADGAMEGTIGIQSELLSLQQRLLFETDYNTAKQEIDEAEEFAKGALDRMMDSGLMNASQVDQLHKQIDVFRESRVELLDSHNQLDQSNKNVDQSLTQIDNILGFSEETLEQRMDGGNLLKLSKTQIQNLWDMADAMMETRISLLGRGHILSQIMSLHLDANAAQAELDDLLGEAKELVDYLIVSDLANTRVEGQLFSDVLANEFQNYQNLFDTALVDFESYQQAKKRQEVETNKLLELIEAMEEDADSKVEAEAAVVEPTISGSINLLIGTIIFGLLLSFGGLVFAIKLFIDPIKNVSSQLMQISQGDGDLRVRIDNKSNDEVGELADGFNAFVEKTHIAIQKVRTAVDKLHTSCQNLDTVSQQTTTGIHHQQNETNMAATAMTEMSASVDEVSKFAASAASAAEKSNQQTSDGQATVSQTIESINQLANEVESAASVIHKLESESESIGTVLDVIRGIADQTNLLALNAAIEAARAGEQGRGFAVVADEVRTLAGRTQQSTEEIQSMIEKLQQGTGQAVKVMNNSLSKVEETVNNAQQAGIALTTIASAVSEINDMNTQIATASGEQATVTSGVSENVNNINQIASETSGAADQISAATQALVELSDELDGLVSQFKV